MDCHVQTPTHTHHGCTVRQLLARGAQHLYSTSQTPHLDAELLLAHILEWNRSRLFAYNDYIPNAAEVAAFFFLIGRRADLEPVAYLVGHREFYGIELLVDQRVLVPRPETELLVERTLARVATQLYQADRSNSSPIQPLLIADVGTGSGAIAIALAKTIPYIHVYATDISEKALEVTQINVDRYNLAHKITLLHGDLLTPLPEQVDLIVSNPPYTILAEVDEEVRRYQPYIALDGGIDGLYIYRRLIQQVPFWLRCGKGFVLLEIGATQTSAMVELIDISLKPAHMTIYRDLAGWDRVVEVHLEDTLQGGSCTGDPNSHTVQTWHSVR